MAGLGSREDRLNPALATEAIDWTQAAPTVWGHLAIIAALLVVSAFFAGSESALFSLDRYAMDRLTSADRGARGRALLKLLSNPRKLLATLLLGNELVNITITVVGAHLVFELWQDENAVPWWFNILAVTPLLLIFGEITPKAIAVRSSEAWASFVALPLAAFWTLVTPIRGLLEGAADLLLPRKFVDDEDPLPAALEEAQFKALVDLGKSQGVLESEEAEMIHRVFDLSTTPVSRLMTSRADLVCVARGAPLHDVLDQALDGGYSRLPVHAGEPDNIKGILLTKDLLRFRWHREDLFARSLDDLLKPAYFVPPSKPADELLREFQQTRGHMAVVIDEYGAVLGVVTMQDVLDELFEPFNEALKSIGQDDSVMRIERIGDDTYRLPARLEVTEWNRRMSPQIPEGDSYTTVAGYIFHLFGRLPSKGDQTSDKRWTFHVSGVEGTRLTQITAVRRDRRTKKSPGRTEQ